MDAIKEVDAECASTESELNKIQRLKNWANTARHQSDAKAEAIVKWIKKHIKSGNQWTDERVILSLNTERLNLGSRISSKRIWWGAPEPFMVGWMTTKGSTKAGFQADPKQSPVRILLATDAASEGIDLQKHCRFMIHIEIPYNPNVMEQRNGRIDRHGQKASEVLIWHPISADGQIGEDILRFRKIRNHEIGHGQC